MLFQDFVLIAIEGNRILCWINKRKVKWWMLSELDKLLLSYTMDGGNDTVIDNDIKIRSILNTCE